MSEQLPGATIQPVFKPTPHMVVWLEVTIKSDTYVIDEIARISGIAESSYYRWLKIPGFIEWFNNEWNVLIKAHAWQLDVIGLKNAKSDFKYWEAMQKRLGNLHEDKDESNSIPQTIGIEEVKKKLDMYMQFVPDKTEV